MFTNNLCKCNNCESILIDMNPKDDTEYQITGNELEMKWDEKEFAWVCPLCMTDAYLTDDLGGEYLPIT